ncbi:heterokaryon incompatibility protein-domain-containing protein [Xylaria castorea]|nr:heterokaryon incompatibility protein-domain-containing protein [Xylaria castorea]
MEDIIPFSGDGELPFDADDQFLLFPRSAQNTSMKYELGCIAPFRVNLTTWESDERYWPRRLLHIPTLTSYERSDNDTYNGIKEPDYSILSYTWGRFQVKDPSVGKSLPIKGVSWNIPAVQESHFTVDQFHKVLNLMGLDGTEWAWVDIACIDQENVKIKMDEVGRQASIFRAAKWAFVWLSHLSTETCFRSFGLIERVMSQLWPKYKLHDASAEEMKLPLRYLQEAFDSICLDPWFTSLWTLQEIMMRNDALIVSSEGAIVTQCVPPYTARGGVSNLTAFYREQVSMWPMFFNRVASDWRHVHDEVVRLAAKIENSSDKTQSDYDSCLQSKQIGQLINSTGINHVSSNNPNVQYGVAKYRKTEYPEDRVYGIMQIYNIRVGQSIRSDDLPSLDELIEEFGFAINYKSVVQGQTFVHTSTSKPKLSWCITEYSDVPHGLRNISEVRIRSTITKGASSSIQIQGKGCLFTEFLEVHNRDVSGLSHTMGSQLRLYLDSHIVEFIEPGVDPWLWWDDASLLVRYELGGRAVGEDWTRSQETWLRHYRMAKKTSKIYGLDRLRVLELGDCAGRYSGDFKDDKDNNPNRFFQVDLPPRTHIGILICRVEDKTEPDQPGVYERLGICTWVANPSLEEYGAIKSENNGTKYTYNLMVETFLQKFVSFSKTITELIADDITVRIK